MAIISSCLSTAPRAGESENAENLVYAPAVQVGNLANEEITESSGLAESRIRPGVFWTHNDSGDQPRLFAFDELGVDLGVFPVTGVEAVDWEDLAYVSLNGHSALLVADTGNNQRERQVLTLYLVAEPQIGRDRFAKCLQTVRFRFDDGNHDCEAVAFDTDRKSVLLATKTIATSGIYELPWPRPIDDEIQKARKIGKVNVPFATGMDIASDNSRLIMTTYLAGYEFTRHSDENWSQACSRRASVVRMPVRLQGESVCYGAGGTSLFLTSEKRPTPLFQIRRRQ